MSEEAGERNRAQVYHPGPLTFHVTLRQNSGEKQGFLRLDHRRPQGGQDTSFPLRPIQIGVVLCFRLFIFTKKALEGRTWSRPLAAVSPVPI